MRNDSGMLMVGVFLLILGIGACNKGLSGESVAIQSNHRATGMVSNSTPGFTMFIGILFVLGGGYCLHQSGYFRNSK